MAITMKYSPNPDMLQQQTVDYNNWCHRMDVA